MNKGQGGGRLVKGRGQNTLTRRDSTRTYIGFSGEDVERFIVYDEVRFPGRGAEYSPPPKFVGNEGAWRKLGLC